MGNKLFYENICGYIEKAAERGTEIHSFIFEQNGEILGECTVPPYSANERKLLYSLSKTFTSVLFGIAVDEGLISDETKTTEFFGDKLPENPDKLLFEQKFKHLLSMTCGHGGCNMLEMISADDCVRLYFQKPMVYKPGERFIYSTASTCVCAAAIERAAGKPFMDYAMKKLFMPLGIEKPLWETMSDGTVQGGTGLHLNAWEILKLAQMLLNKGIYNNQRIVSEEWIDKMTRSYSIDPVSTLPDWNSGYGYQVRMNSRGGFRGDGAYGQLMVIIPESRTIFVQLAEALNMQEEMNCAFELIQGKYHNTTKILEDFYCPHATKIFNSFRLLAEPNAADIKEITAETDGETLVLAFDGKPMRCGKGKFIKNNLKLKNITPKINGYSGSDGDEICLYAAYETAGDNLTLIIRHADCVHSAKWQFAFENGRFSMKIVPRTGAPLCDRINGKIIT